MAIDATLIRIDQLRSMVFDADLGGAVTIGDAVYVDSNGAVQAARANAAATSKAVGLLVELGTEIPGTTVGASGNRGTVCNLGHVYCAGWGLTPGAIYYVSSGTAGAITATAPTGATTWTAVIGYALDANTLFVQAGALAPVSNS